MENDERVLILTETCMYCRMCTVVLSGVQQYTRTRPHPFDMSSPGVPLLAASSHDLKISPIDEFVNSPQLCTPFPLRNSDSMAVNLYDVRVQSILTTDVSKPI